MHLTGLYIYNMKKINYISTSHLNNISSKVLKRPDWIKVRAPLSQNYKSTKELIDTLKLNTVCQEAACPNIGECWEKKHATVMILGRICTRKCTFCNIATGKPNNIDVTEPINVAKAVASLKLKHVVITSVDRDDLKDGGAQQFADCINKIRLLDKNVTIEILTPDFQRKSEAIQIIVDSFPDVFNHNLETVPRIYKSVRKGADFNHSLELLKIIKIKNNKIWTKSGIMVGLGETINEILEVMIAMRKSKVDFITIGQYLQPSSKHHKLVKYYSLEEFKHLEKKAWQMGFKMVSSSPLTRSSYHADTDFEKLRSNFG